jgi:hypothetical protein
MILDKVASIGSARPRAAQLGRKMPISATPAFQDALVRALEAYLQDPSSIGLTIDLAVLAQAHGALPVYADIGGAMLIRRTGEVLLVHSNQEWTAASEWSVVTEAQWLEVAYVSCERRYPTLRGLLSAVSDVVRHRLLTIGSNDRGVTSSVSQGGDR